MEEIESEHQETPSKQIKSSNGFLMKKKLHSQKKEEENFRDQELLTALEIKKLMNQCDILENENKILRKQVAQMSTNMSSTTHDYDDLLNVIEMLKLNNNNIQEKLQEKDLENHSLRTFISDLVKQQNLRDQQLDEFTKELNYRMEKWKALISEKEQEINSLNAQLINIQDLYFNSDNMNIKNKKNKIEILSQKLAKREEQILELVDLLSKTSFDLHLIKSSLDQFEDNIDFDSNSSQQRMIIRNLNDELNSMKEKLSQAEEEASNKSEQISELIIQLREYETGEYGLAEAVLDIKKLKQELKLKEKNLQEIISHLNDKNNIQLPLSKNETEGNIDPSVNMKLINKQLEIVNVQTIDIPPIIEKIEEKLKKSSQPILKVDKATATIPFNEKLTLPTNIYIKDDSKYDSFISEIKNFIDSLKVNKKNEIFSPIIFSLELILKTLTNEKVNPSKQSIIKDLEINMEMYLKKIEGVSRINATKTISSMSKEVCDQSIQVDSRDFLDLEYSKKEISKTELLQTFHLDEQIKKYNSLICSYQNSVTHEIKNSESQSKYLNEQSNIIQGVLNELSHLRKDFSSLIQLIPLKDLGKIIFNLSQEKEGLKNKLRESLDLLREKQNVISIFQNILKQFNEDYTIFPNKDILISQNNLNEILMKILYTIKIKNDEIYKLNDELILGQNNFQMYKMTVAKEQEGLHLILQTKQQCIQKLIEKYKELSQSSSPNSAEILECLTKINNLEDEIEDFKNDKKILKEQLASSLEEKEKIISLIETKSFEIELLQKENQVYKTEIVSLSEKLTDIDMKSRISKSFIKAVDSTIKTNKAKSLKNKLQAEVLKEDNNNIELEEYKAKTLQMNTEISSLTLKNDHLYERNTILEKRLHHMERIFVTKEQKFNLIKRHLQQEVKNLTSKLNELKHDYLEEFVKVKARKNQCDMAFSNWLDRKKNQKSLESLKLLLVEKKQEILDLSKKNSNLEKHINRLQTEKKHLQYILGNKSEETNNTNKLF